MGPVAQRVFKTRAVVQPTARSVRLRRRSVEPKPSRVPTTPVKPAGAGEKVRNGRNRQAALPFPRLLVPESRLDETLLASTPAS